ncbi:Hypothetical_protein [Hexamita inflata]|uniref:Hypothetical_protein n=1 Tax=Hexamita inflata TaxID=28002 RepID=A0AA86UAQ6_9EUKA|nr:Hypothetical protein HINF_LOCUS35699 [Hexamita inflata]
MFRKLLEVVQCGLERKIISSIHILYNVGIRDFFDYIEKPDPVEYRARLMNRFQHRMSILKVIEHNDDIFTDLLHGNWVGEIHIIIIRFCTIHYKFKNISL